MTRHPIFFLLTLTTLLLAVGCAGPSGFSGPSVAPEQLALAGDTLEARLASDVRLAADGPDAGPVARQEARRFYDERGYELAWISEDGVRPGARELVEAVREAHRLGLSEQDTTRLEAFLETPLLGLRAADGGEIETRVVAERLAALDLALTETYLTFAGQRLEGRLQPETAQVGWHTRPRHLDATAHLTRALAEDRVALSLTELDPPHQGYRDLLTALAHYREIEQRGGWPQVSGEPAFESGSSAANVRQLAHRLAMTGDLDAGKDWTPETLPTTFDGDLSLAVRRFQNRHGLPTDGKVGPDTLAALNIPVTDKIRTLEANLERWRWMPVELGERYVEVNIPDFDLRVVEQGKTALHMRVVVGEQGRNQTPMFSDSLQYVVVNPSWNVPESIAQGEEFPKIAADPSYLAAKNFELVRGWEEEAAPVDPYTVDWSDPSALQGLRLRQRPGAGNALGQVKFMFPNEFNVYLHDTPADSAFSRQERDLSHGCIRLERPLALAAYVLGKSEDQVRAEVAAGATRTHHLKQNLPVHILYWTAWVDEHGRYNFRNDVYGVDRMMDDALEQAPHTLQVAALQLPAEATKS